ncbi:asparagine synthase (glutamine-hydrolyzing) [Goodfellowiella coeruleoviolacea]|uniref:asparagine synthase (glutamine-hydrolyzing) n=1 Tax=Goodfellowiella coeruleoviolacea TaxID=334858 RepID=A0AAE3KPW7_9PSEU|nr:asparagine synthase (glutamine-hydrolyzing) [Goodfellowiella coeruleoviolacea]MCP2170318.1 asparagine synthase (glutamine-hydrolyzing) [Goodfellowiella coeruleoviolacea]
MCGITGWVSFDRDLSTERPTVEAMTETMSCRGPDAAGTWYDRHAALGHRRLAIIDLPGGAQPMAEATADGQQVAMVYSGESYNFTELRDELRRRGHQFRTDSDTEVVLHGYLEWGEALAERLNGMYAFAIWDSRSQKLVMVRDRMGIKPFYYYPTADGVLFGSEPKAILANPLAKRVVGLTGLRELMSFSKTPGEAIWEGMREVVPGTVVTVDRNGLREHVYWRLGTHEHTDDQQTTVTRVRELLDDIVRRQLVADVPRCVLLSGGLDSSAITALASQQLGEQGEKVRSFAVDFVGQAENFVADELRGTPDTPYVHDVAEHVASEHSDIVLDHTRLADPDVRRRVITARDLPNSLGDMDASLFLLFKAIREHSTVALSGESADEVFGGYRWFHEPEVQRADTFPWIASRVLSGQTQRRTVYSADLLAKADLAGYMRDGYASAVAEVDPLPGESEHERRMRVISYLHLTRFVRVLLDRKDRMSMAVGLEVRVPFCDHRLVEYVYNAPWSLKTYDSREKSLLRGATRDVLPQSVVDRVKSPYPSTQDPHYAAAIQQQLKELLANRDHQVFDLMDRAVLTELAELDPTSMPSLTRNSIDLALNMATWLDIYRPEMRLS